MKFLNKLKMDSDQMHAIFTMMLVGTLVFLRLSTAAAGGKYQISIGGLIIHHFWLGVVLFVAVYFIPRKLSAVRAVLFPIGLAMIADELPLLFIGFQKYTTIYSLLGTALVTGLFIFLFIPKEKRKQKSSSG